MTTAPGAKLSLHPPLAPMEASSVDELPKGDCWQYEPKWDGFRCLAFRERDRVALQSKSGKMLTRYFPELVEAVLALEAQRFVLDSEIVVPSGRAFSFDALLQRIHPASSRVRRLAQETPAQLIVFDLLAGSDGASLLGLRLRERRRKLEEFADRYFARAGMVQLSPATTDLRRVKSWLKRVGTGLDGIVAKRLDFAYRSGDRSGMQKIKRQRTADCVVGGFRYGRESARSARFCSGSMMPMACCTMSASRPRSHGRTRNR